MGRKRQERALENALTKALATGIRVGEKRAFERTLRSVALEALGLDVRDSADLLESVGVKKALPLISEAATTTWPQRYRERLSPVLSALMEHAAEGAAPVLGSFTLANPRMADFFNGYVSELSDGLANTSYENARRAIEEAQAEGLSMPDAAARLREKLPELNATRAELIARTEVHRSSVGASHIQAAQSGVVKSKTWLTAGDDRVREEHAAMDGEEVPIAESFSNGSMFPDEVNCRCVLTYEIDHEALRAKVA